ncbi:cryptochrome/photolyase family protein [Pseudoxanthomonas mexicana]|uniref:Cryptochrome/photolyase family protein n=1 Tax=Pseudoxanthomonas mexicana TaxID=128785 RepID=A0ABX6RH73_PSEMX|nr:cryptochrome/photolyase family protein [Pseudoxanthomonas mexicana]
MPTAAGPAEVTPSEHGRSAPPAHTLRLILGDQLDPQHPWFARVDPGVLHVMMEMRQETDYVLHHAQKILAIFAAMRAFAAHLRAQGHRVRYVAIDDPSNRQRLTENLDALLALHGASTFAYQPADEWRLDTQLRDWAATLPIAVERAADAHFLAARDEAGRLFGARRQWRMETFYRHMRRRLGVLLEPDGTPAGGRWNFDQDNRAAWPGTPPAPADWRRPHDHRALWRAIEAAGVASFGAPQADALCWPLDRDEALADLDAFVEQALPWFGQYQDAMSTQAPRLFHSLLSFALNTKMLHPAEVIARAEAAWRAGHAPLPAMEGFIRQILGWREYVRGVYWAQMPGYVALNHFGHDTPLPDWFWTGRVRMRCLADAIGQSLAQAHAHHIQRLMVIGNFSLLAGLDPQALHRWYLGVYIDAFEWVELPNTLGMSQFADGGRLASKPYVSGSAYLHRMSDYCNGCPYDRRQRTGARACPFNALYWDFLDRHRIVLQSNPRMALAYRQLARMDGAAREALSMQARQVRGMLEDL